MEPAAVTFITTLKQFPEYFRFDKKREEEWFENKILKNDEFKSLNLPEEVEMWSYWVEGQYQLKKAHRSNKFPKSNYRMSLLNWLRISIRRGLPVYEGEEGLNIPCIKQEPPPDITYQEGTPFSTSEEVIDQHMEHIRKMFEVPEDQRVKKGEYLIQRN